MELDRWQFWIDRGGTFTDVVACRPDGHLLVHKLLSENPDCYPDAALEAIRRILGCSSGDAIAARQIAAVKMGTTIATNALLQRRGESTVLVITAGFRDALRIAYQNRPNIFALQITLPELLYCRVIEVAERYSASGEELLAPNLKASYEALTKAYDDGITSCAIVFMHGYRYPAHEAAVAAIARQIGFKQVSVSHEVNPVMKLVSRGDTTVVDAYLSPILRDYVDGLARELKGTKLMFMQSNGGLAEAHHFQGKDSILSGPAGGIVGAVKTSVAAGFNKIITFDMGGTSTDVSHFDGEYERTYETEVAGVRLRAPMMAIHTVAAGGGSILHFDGIRYRVGPDSAGANPGPACYRKNGPLTITDCNVLLGKLQPQYFPQVFGSSGNLPLDQQVVKQKFQELSVEIKNSISDQRSPEEVAEGFLAIAIDNMARAIKKISTERGYDITEYTLCCFGGAGGQHACLLADSLGMTRIFLHPYAGVLSAYGIGLSDASVIRQQAVEAILSDELLSNLENIYSNLELAGLDDIQGQAIADHPAKITRRIHLRYEGTDTAQVIEFGTRSHIIDTFEKVHQNHYGFIVPDKNLVVEAISIELIAPALAIAPPTVIDRQNTNSSPVDHVTMFTNHAWQETPVYKREQLPQGSVIQGPAIVIESTGTNIIEPNWQCQVTSNHELVLERVLHSSDSLSRNTDSAKRDPVMLEIFNNLFMSVAEQMGLTLQNTSQSVNIKERLDFSCALFDGHGDLIANAPHIPVHLGSMSESVQAIMAARKRTIRPGDVFALNNPYNGGTHLPDITVVTPVFDESGDEILFFTASRGHHSDIGGITPGSMPPESTSVTEEGILIDNFQLVKDSSFCEKETIELLSSGPYPARNIKQNLADLKAQVAANERGVKELRKMIKHWSLATIQAYMDHVKDNAEESVRQVIDRLSDGSFTCTMDDGSQICVQVSVDRIHRNATIDFSGTSPQKQNNFNAPASVCKSAVLYVFRTLVKDEIPLNAGCMKPLKLIIPDGSMLNPKYPAAVVAGNVETSQAITDALFGALGVMSACQGTMNNLTFGNDQLQYYETICGGSGAGPDFEGTDAVHTHMTNSRLTDPEVLEWRFPILVEEFSIRSDSGGQGLHNGGNGVVRKLRFRQELTAAILSTRRSVAPFGLAGGQAGKCGRNWIKRHNGLVETLAGTATVQMAAGDVLVIETPGGGGYGVKPI